MAQNAGGLYYAGELRCGTMLSNLHCCGGVAGCGAWLALRPLGPPHAAFWTCSVERCWYLGESVSGSHTHTTWHASNVPFLA